MWLRLAMGALVFFVSWKSEFEGKVMRVLKAIQFASLLSAWGSGGLKKSFWVEVILGCKSL